MNRTFLIAWLVAFVALMGGSFAVHGAWLAPQYAALTMLYRPEAEQMSLMPWLVGAHVIIAGAVAWMYGRGVSAAPWMGQGVRFGLALTALTAPTYMIYYSVQPIPMSLMWSQIIGDAVVLVVVGMATAFVHKGAAKA